MTGRLPRYVRERDGAFYVRMGVPAELRPYIGRSELHEGIGSSRTEALRRHHAVVVRFQAQLADAKAKYEAKALPFPQPRRPSPRKFAAALYHEQVSADALARDSGAYAAAGIDPAEQSRVFDPAYVAALRKVANGTATDDLIAATIGWALDEFSGGVPLDPTEWRRLARQLAGVQIEVLARRAEANEGKPLSEPEHPLLTDKPATVEQLPVSILGLLDGYLGELQASGKGAEARKRWTPGFKAFVAFLGHDDARRVTKSDVVAFKEQLLGKLAPKTVRDTNIAALRAVFQWAEDNEKCDANPVRGVKVKLAPKIQNREQGFTDDEAAALLQVAATYQPPHSDNPQTRESDYVTAAKRWAPWLCAFTGARVAEITQLRKEDVQTRDGITFLRITPEAGSVKTGRYRDVPIHPQLVERGFLDFVAASNGPLFFDPNRQRRGRDHPSKIVAKRLALWLRTLDCVPADVDPNHGWRHRFKTIGRDLGIDPRVLDAIQGHAARTAGENYGDVTLTARSKAILLIPKCNVSRGS